MSVNLQEILKQLSEALETSDSEAIAELREDYGDTFEEIFRGLCSEGEPESVAEYFPDLQHVDTDCVAGDGSEAYCVFKHVPTGTHVGFDGWYASYEGYSFDDKTLKEMETFTVQHWRPKTKK